MYDIEAMKGISRKVSENIAELMTKERSVGKIKKVLLVEVSHPKGYLSLHEGITRIQTFTGVSEFLVEKEQSEVTSSLFV